MDIEDAFTQDMIAETGTNVVGEEEQELRGVIRRIYESNEMGELANAHENVAVLCFVAGRAYQANITLTHIPIPIEIVPEFMEFLAQRSAL